MNKVEGRALRSVLFSVLTALALFGLPGRGQARGRLAAEDVGHEPVHVGKGETLNESVATTGPIAIEGTLNADCLSLGGPVDISGEVSGDVASIGGPVRISGVVKGDVASVGGDVTLEDRSTVYGDVALLGGKLNQSKSAVLKGQVAHLDWSMLKRFGPLFARHARRGEIPEALERVSFGYRLIRYAAFLAFIAGIGLMVFLLSIFVPAQVERVAEAVKEDFWRSAGIGALVLMSIFPGLLLMVVSVLGIPLVPMAIILVCAAVLMSFASFSLLLTGRFYGSLGRPAPAGTIAGVGIGYLLLISLLIVGKLLAALGAHLLGGIFVLANMMVFCCAVVVGLGAIWTTRMGSRKEAGN